VGGTTDGLLDDARTILPRIVEVRRALHRRPEVGLQLPGTQELVVRELEQMGLAPRLGKTVGSVTAAIEGARLGDGRHEPDTAPPSAEDANVRGHTVLLRADMDALPLREETGLDFASATGDTMHACGHDTHVAMLLGAARLLLDRAGRFDGNVLLMFQPGEEGWHGARFMLEDGLLDAAPTPVRMAFALHITNKYPRGRVAIRPGPTYAAADRIRMTVRGRGGHASAPHSALDPITVAAEIVLALQLLVTRTVDVFDPAVVTIAHVRSGTRDNIIPETAFLEGTMRTVSEETRSRLQAGVRRLAEGVAMAHGASVEVEIEPGYPVTVNDAAVAGMVRQVASDLLGPDNVEVPDAPVMGAEDFSYVLQRVPGAMAHLGGRPADMDETTAPQNHSNRVVFDETAMVAGAALHAAVALRYLAADDPSAGA